MEIQIIVQRYEKFCEKPRVGRKKFSASVEAYPRPLPEGGESGYGGGFAEVQSGYKNAGEARGLSQLSCGAGEENKGKRKRGEFGSPRGYVGGLVA